MLPKPTETMERCRLIVILRGSPGDMLPDVLDALYEGGARLAEITFDAAGNVPDEETAAQIGRAAARMAGKMHIGAGTVLTEEQLRRTEAAGGSFFVSPHTDPSLIEAAKGMGLMAVPGAMTPSEIVAAHRAGADYVKLFPVSVLGPDFIRRMRGPLPHIKLLAVSGADLGNIPAYLEAGAAGFGIGRAVANPELCANGDFSEIRRRAAAYAKACGKPAPTGRNYDSDN